jgi:hypothetical protein
VSRFVGRSRASSKTRWQLSKHGFDLRLEIAVGAIAIWAVAIWAVTIWAVTIAAAAGAHRRAAGALAAEFADFAEDGVELAIELVEAGIDVAWTTGHPRAAAHAAGRAELAHRTAHFGRAAELEATACGSESTAKAAPCSAAVWRSTITGATITGATVARAAVARAAIALTGFGAAIAAVAIGALTIASFTRLGAAVIIIIIIIAFAPRARGIVARLQGNEQIARWLVIAGKGVRSTAEESAGCEGGRQVAAKPRNVAGPIHREVSCNEGQ